MFCDEIAVKLNAAKQVCVFCVLKGYTNILLYYQVRYRLYPVLLLQYSLFIFQTSAPNQWSSPAVQFPALASDFAIGTNPDGSFDIVGVGYLSLLMHVRQTDPNNMNAWAAQEWISGCTGLSPIVATNGDGRLELFFIDTTHDRAVWTAWQTSPGGEWSGCVSLGVMADTIAVGHAGDHLELIYSYNGQASHMWLDGTQWSAPQPFASKEPLFVPTSITVMENPSTGVLEAFSVHANHTVLHSYQLQAGNATSWVDWEAIGGWAY